MHDEPGRLVDHDHVLVVVDDRELHRCVGRGQLGRRQLGLVDIDDLTELQAHACPMVLTTPSTVAPPAATSAAASERLASVTSATIRSRRSPASAGGISSWIMPVGPGDAEISDPQHEQRATDVDGHVGDVEDREPLEVDEVDDRAVQDPIPRNIRSSEVADRAAGDQAGSDTR